MISPELTAFFSDLPETTWQKLAAFKDQVLEWNSKINLISRKDIDQIEINHILPSLAFLKAHDFKAGERVVDVGTGGGFPGLVLAIACPKTSFLLVDSVGKKINAVKAIAEALELSNVKIHAGRAEAIRGFFDTVIGRAVASLPDFFTWVAPILNPKHSTVVYLKGGDLEEDLKQKGLSPKNHYLLDNVLAPLPYPGKYIVTFMGPEVRRAYLR